MTRPEKDIAAQWSTPNGAACVLRDEQALKRSSVVFAVDKEHSAIRVKRRVDGNRAQRR
jgi:hypothetical protein